VASPCLFERGRARNLEFDGSFREGLEEISMGDSRAEQSRENPDQENFLVVPIEPFLRQTCLPRPRQKRSIFSHAGDDCK